MLNFFSFVFLLQSWAQGVILEASQRTKFFQHEKKMGELTSRRIEEKLSCAEKFSSAQIAERERAVDADVAHLELTEGRVENGLAFVHIDMDAFFCAVEELDNPQLVGKPHAVGGMHMLCTASYEARKYGVRSAMPGFIARKLCPQLIFDKPRFQR